MEKNILIAILLTSIAGLSTGLGGVIAILAKQVNKNFLSVSLGFSAGVMIYVSFIEIFPKAQESLVQGFGLKIGSILTVVAFFTGILVIGIIDKMVPAESNPHELNNVSGIKEDKESKKLMRMGIFTALAISLHNFPEGLATFISALQDPTLAIPIVVAIAIHNIPEGISVAVPIYFATGSKMKALGYSFLSGVAEPIGALIGWLLLMQFMSPTVMGLIFASVAGIMIFISLDKLLPTAQVYGEHHLSIYGLVAGMITMAMSLLLFI